MHVAFKREKVILTFCKDDIVFGGFILGGGGIGAFVALQTVVPAFATCT